MLPVTGKQAAKGASDAAAALTRLTYVGLAALVLLCGAFAFMAFRMSSLNGEPRLAAIGFSTSLCLFTF